MTALLPDTPAEFRLWLDTLPEDAAWANGTEPIARFWLAIGGRGFSVGYSDYSIDGGIAEPLPDWATDVIHTVDSGFYPTVGDLRRHLDGERPRFLTGEVAWDDERRAWVAAS